MRKPGWPDSFLLFVLLLAASARGQAGAVKTEKALAALEGNDVVLGPAEDGGYVLIGLRRPIRELFDDLAWGTETVLAETRRRIRALGLRSHELPPLWDLDRPSDLVRYRRHQRSTTCRRR